MATYALSAKKLHHYFLPHLYNVLIYNKIFNPFFKTIIKRGQKGWLCLLKTHRKGVAGFF